MFREVEKSFEREKHLSTKQSSDESQNYRNIKPKGNITKEEANNFWANKFAQEAKERRETGETVNWLDIFLTK